MGQAEQVLADGVVLLDLPAHPGGGDEFRDRRAARGVGEEESDLFGMGGAAADEQHVGMARSGILAADGDGDRTPVIQAQALAAGPAGAAFPDRGVAVSQQPVQDMTGRFDLAARIEHRHVHRHGQHVADVVLVAEGVQAGFASVDGVAARVAEQGGGGEFFVQHRGPPGPAWLRRQPVQGRRPRCGEPHHSPKLRAGTGAG
ncbi:hypothetical protein PW035_63005 [Nonomuraea angiospora]|nr:hypothetical protein [Nonomuraea angiospora]MDX3111573.1 hypothetical protein [Nonomuraea angiospora]